MISKKSRVVNCGSAGISGSERSVYCCGCAICGYGIYAIGVTHDELSTIQSAGRVEFDSFGFRKTARYREYRNGCVVRRDAEESMGSFITNVQVVAPCS